MTPIHHAQQGVILNSTQDLASLRSLHPVELGIELQAHLLFASRETRGQS
jgi:hypothetical protein